MIKPILYEKLKGFQLGSLTAKRAMLSVFVNLGAHSGNSCIDPKFNLTSDYSYKSFKNV